MINKIKELFLSDTLRSRFIKSSGILAVASGLENIGRLARNMIIARILAPEEFGIMAIILAVTWSLKAFSQVGIPQCIVQSKSGNRQEFLNSAWWLNSGLGFFIAITGLIGAPVVAEFYGRSELTNMLRIASLTILMDSMMSPRTYILEKEFEYSKWAVIMQGAGFVNVITALILAFYLKSVWALVIALFCEAMFRLIFSFILCPFQPVFKIEKESKREIFKFAMGIMGLPILLMIFAHADVFFLGKLLPMAEVGKYSLALVLSKMVHMIYSTTVGRLMIPLFSHIQDDLIRFKKNFLKITGMICLYGIPFISFLGVYSKPILVIVYGAVYASIAPAFILLCVYLFFSVLNEIMASCCIALAKPNLYRNYSFYRFLLVISLLYPLIKAFGAVGAATAVLLATVFFWLLLLNKLKRIVQVELSQYFLLLLKGIGSSILIIASGLLLPFINIKSEIINLSLGCFICCLTWAVVAYYINFKNRNIITA